MRSTLIAAVALALTAGLTSPAVAASPQIVGHASTPFDDLDRRVGSATYDDFCSTHYHGSTCFGSTNVRVKVSGLPAGAVTTSWLEGDSVEGFACELPSTNPARRVTLRPHVDERPISEGLRDPDIVRPDGTLVAYQEVELHSPLFVSAPGQSPNYGCPTLQRTMFRLSNLRLHVTVWNEGGPDNEYVLPVPGTYTAPYWKLIPR